MLGVEVPRLKLAWHDSDHHLIGDICSGWLPGLYNHIPGTPNLIRSASLLVYLRYLRNQDGQSQARLGLPSSRL